MKRWLIIFALLLPIVAACGQGPTAETDEDEDITETSTTADEQAASDDDDAADDADDAETDETSTTASGMEVDRSRLSDELYFFNWSEYIDPQLLEDFEDEYGVRVIEDFYDSNESMLPKVQAGNSGYDIVAPSDYAVEILVEEELLAPLDKDLLPNLEYIDPDLLDLYYDPGNTYSAPYFWGTTGIAYNQTFFDEPPTSWSTMFEPENMEEFEGQFTMLEDPRETPGAALTYLGYSVNTTNPDELEEAEELLLQQKPYLAAYDSSNVNLKLATEEIAIAHAYDGAAATAILGIEDKPGNPNIAYTIPEEGGVIWQDNLVILDESPNKYTAHVFINYLLDPEIAARNTDYVLYLTPNEEAWPLMEEETRELLNDIMPDEEMMDRLQWIRRSEETDALYTDLWTRVVSQ